jgi:hypothetical protein
VVELYLVIKQIIIKYIIFFKKSQRWLKNEERRKYVLVVINDKIKIRQAKVEGEEGFF